MKKLFIFAFMLGAIGAFGASMPQADLADDPTFETSSSDLPLEG
ncbi:hypothetical protein B0H94_11533 [Salsuginibacillus halophilus]|uniref:PapR protein n=1 Tax=Salsuginibacillus halophilus TaxID=517424 RepID=A0A2P8H8C0_9BACI|nr:hypothetical protein [Salsuginibacillus halophilus]PSL42429.1 hypothetical protein B0H94_11533 [Salsuginibacillus halophilus]